MVFKAKIQENRGKTTLKTLFFSLALFNNFWEGLGRVWGGFWEGFGAYLASLGALLAPFLGGCIFNALPKGF